MSTSRRYEILLPLRFNDGSRARLPIGGHRGSADSCNPPLPRRNTGMAFQDSLNMIRVGFQRPFAAFVSTAQQNTVTAREHVKIGFRIDDDVAVVDLRLRSEEGQLTFDRNERFVVEKL